MDVQPSDVKINIISENSNKGVFSIDPLPKGYGNTLGNALRRTLLSSIPGAAATQVKIKGATHQFSTIKGVKEDTVELSLNLKQIRFANYANEPVVVTLSKKGEGVVTAGDIQTSSSVKVLNTDLHLATLSDDKTTLEMELIVEPGVGYSPMEERQTTKIGVIVLDALYSPVTKAFYTVEPTRFGKSVDLDKIVIEIVTDGSITPLDALKKAAEITESYIQVIKLGGAELSTKIEETTDKAETKTKASEKIAIEDLPLQTRTVNALKKSGIDTYEQLSKLKDEDLMDIKNLGEKALTEIKKLLEKEGLR